MKRFYMLLIMILLLNCFDAVGQDRTQHPIATAHIVGLDGRVELVFDEAITEAFTISVLDLTGKAIFTQTHQSAGEGCQYVEIPVENLKRGIYMVRINGEDGKTKTLKLQRN